MKTCQVSGPNDPPVTIEVIREMKKSLKGRRTLHTTSLVIMPSGIKVWVCHLCNWELIRQVYSEN